MSAGKFGRKVYAVEYQHATDGTNYRHDFDSAVTLNAESDGSLRLASRGGAPLWGEYGAKQKTMMQNPDAALGGVWRTWGLYRWHEGPRYRDAERIRGTKLYASQKRADTAAAKLNASGQYGGDNVVVARQALDAIKGNPSGGYRGRGVYRPAPLPGIPATPSAEQREMFSRIRPGARVKVMTAHGGTISGTVPLLLGQSSDGSWTFNAGGKYGTPRIATPRNILAVSGGRLRDNPRGRKVKKQSAGRGRRRTATARKGAGVPAWVRAKGFTSWGAYMASIRPGGTMARRKGKKRAAKRSPRRRRRSVARARAAAPRKRARRRFRRNPFGSAASIGAAYSPRNMMGLALEGAKDAAAGVGGMAVARLVRGRLNLDGNTPKGSIAELGITLLAAPLVGKFLGPKVARAFVQGGFMGPALTAIKSAHVPILSPALGDEGELPLFGGVYDEALGGTYDVDALAAGAPAIAAGGRVGDEELGGESWN